MRPDPTFYDADFLADIVLLSEVIVAASASDHPLCAEEIDRILDVA